MGQTEKHMVQTKPAMGQTANVLKELHHQQHFHRKDKQFDGHVDDNMAEVMHNVEQAEACPRLLTEYVLQQPQTLVVQELINR